jgi:3-hydroxyisobutyrate dehydrogenase-like beta-hydroxyacid dehydrogenase
VNSTTATAPSLTNAASTEAQSSPMAQRPTRPEVKFVGVIGLGRMGQAFAESLISAGFEVIAFDRDSRRTRTLLLDGAKPATRLMELATCDVVVSSLADDAALETIALAPHGLVDMLPEGAAHVSMSTISPALSRRLAAAHAGRGQGYVAAPVLGNPDLARSRQLFILAGGPADTIERVRPVLDRLGQRVFVIGDDAGLANVMKLAGNVLTAATLQSMGEVFALLRKAGIDPHLAFDVLTSSLFDGRVHKVYGGKIVEERHDPPGMTTPLAVKDLRLALAEAEGLAVPMPVAGVVHDRLVAMMARGWAGLDWSALGLLAASDAGIGAFGATSPRQP